MSHFPKSLKAFVLSSVAAVFLHSPMFASVYVSFSLLTEYELDESSSLSLPSAWIIDWHQHPSLYFLKSNIFPSMI